MRRYIRGLMVGLCIFMSLAEAACTPASRTSPPSPTTDLTAAGAVPSMPPTQVPIPETTVPPTPTFTDETTLVFTLSVGPDGVQYAFDGSDHLWYEVSVGIAVLLMWRPRRPLKSLGGIFDIPSKNGRVWVVEPACGPVHSFGELIKGKKR